MQLAGPLEGEVAVEAVEARGTVKGEERGEEEVVVVVVAAEEKKEGKGSRENEEKRKEEEKADLQEACSGEQPQLWARTRAKSPIRGKTGRPRPRPRPAAHLQRLQRCSLHG